MGYRIINIGSGQILFSLFLCILLVTGLPLRASGEELVTVRVRTVEATNMLSDTNRTRRVKIKYEISDGVNDIESKLETLPFRTFQLLSTQSRQVRINSSEHMELTDGHKLSFKPVSKEGKKVCLWLRWNDDNGAEVLDTRMHLSIGESMITGLEKTGKTGIILAIDVTPAVVEERAVLEER